MYSRRLNLGLANQETCFLWGARQTGKSTLLKTLYPNALRYDLLRAGEYRRLLQNPSLLREECLAYFGSGPQSDPVIVDEIQKIPELLDEAQSLIEDHHIRFIFCGSSARKLKRGHANLLGGRAIRYELHPLVYPEIPDFSIEVALNSGLLPRHYASPNARRMMQAYVDDYLREEIAAEALTRNIPAFSRFMEVAALSNGETLNYQNIARECGVSSPTVKEYFQILEDTLLGKVLPAFSKRKKRRLVSAPKFFFFDLAPVIHLTGRGDVSPGSELFGRAFEHFIWMEITAHSAYSEKFYPLSYWRTSSQLEVDFVLGDAQIAVEVKSTEAAGPEHLRGLRAFKEEYPEARCLLVSRDSRARRTEDGILILPWEEFLKNLWGDAVL